MTWRQSRRRLSGARGVVRAGVVVAIGTFEDAGGIAQYSVATLQTAGRRSPAPLQPSIQQLSIGRLVIPDGDRRHRPESGSVVDQVPIPVRDEDVVRVLVLSEDGLDSERWLAAPTPVEGPLKRGLASDCLTQRVALGCTKARQVNQGHVAHRPARNRRVMGADDVTPPQGMPGETTALRSQPRKPIVSVTGVGQSSTEMTSPALDAGTSNMK